MAASDSVLAEEATNNMEGSLLENHLLSSPDQRQTSTDTSGETISPSGDTKLPQGRKRPASTSVDEENVTKRSRRGKAAKYVSSPRWFVYYFVL